MYCIVLYLLPVLNPKSYDGARVLEASGADFGKASYMCDISLGKVGKGLWGLLLELSLNYIWLFIYLFMQPALNAKSYGRAQVLEAPIIHIWLDRGGLGRKYIYRRGLEWLVVARILFSLGN